MTGRSPNRRATGLVLLAAVLWGTAGTAQQLGPDSLTFASVAALRSAIGATLLVGAVLWLVGRPAVGEAWRCARGPILIGSLAMAGFQWGYFGGIRLTGVAIGTLVAIGTAPVTAGLVDLLRGRPPGWRWATGTVTTLVGATMLLVAGTGVALRPAGIALALVAGVSYASYTLASKAALDAGARPSAVMAWTFVGASILLAPALVVEDLAWAASGRGLAVIAWLSVMTIAVAYTAFALGLRRLQAARVTTLTLAEPLTATLLAVLVLAERLTGVALLGAALMVAGLAVSAAPGRARLTPGRAGPAGGAPSDDSRSARPR